MNATIADNTSTSTVVLFNEPMTTLLGYDCDELVITKGYTNPNVLPSPMNKLRGKIKIFQLQFQNLKKEGSATLRVNNVFEPTTTSITTSTSTYTPNMSTKILNHSVVQQPGTLNTY